MKSEYSLRGFSGKTYRDNYAALVTELEHRLAGYRNVFTHNPWGEYGNEEHVQVYRAVNALQERMGFCLWFSNYCSNKSCTMMAQYVPMLGSSYATFETNKVFAKKIQTVYQRNGCWTWYDNYERPDRETFLANGESRMTNRRDHSVFPVNIISTDLPKEYEHRNRARRWWDKIARLLRFLRALFRQVNNGKISKHEENSLVDRTR